MLKEELIKKFGPALIEAVVQITLQEINILRTAAGLPERTSEEMINTIIDKIDDIVPAKLS